MEALLGTILLHRIIGKRGKTVSKAMGSWSEYVAACAQVWGCSGVSIWTLASACVFEAVNIQKFLDHAAPSVVGALRYL